MKGERAEHRNRIHLFYAHSESRDTGRRREAEDRVSTKSKDGHQ